MILLSPLERTHGKAKNGGNSAKGRGSEGAKNPDAVVRIFHAESRESTREDASAATLAQ